MLAVLRFPSCHFFLFVVTHAGYFFLFDSSTASTPRHRHWPRTLQLREWRMMHMQNMHTAIWQMSIHSSDCSHLQFSISLEALLIPTTGGCGQMYEAIIVSPQFTKKTTLARHRLVNSTLKDEIAAIHAWTPKCHTPEEWEKKKPQ
jgi:stress-induced morphogen